MSTRVQQSMRGCQCFSLSIACLTTNCISQCSSSHSHRINEIIYEGLWNGVTFLHTRLVCISAMSGEKECFDIWTHRRFCLSYNWKVVLCNRTIKYHLKYFDSHIVWWCLKIFFLPKGLAVASTADERQRCHSENCGIWKCIWASSRYHHRRGQQWWRWEDQQCNCLEFKYHLPLVFYVI